MMFLNTRNVDRPGCLRYMTQNEDGFSLSRSNKINSNQSEGSFRKLSKMKSQQNTLSACCDLAGFPSQKGVWSLGKHAEYIE